MYRNFRGRKLSQISRFSAIRESFFHEILGMPHQLAMRPVLAFHESFLHEMLTDP